MKYVILLLGLSASVLAATDLPLVRGVDKHGQIRACHPRGPDEVLCTQEFTAGDQFAVDCVAKGGEAIACGCHDYLCILVTE